MVTSINDVPEFKKLKKLTFEDFKYLLLYCKLGGTLTEDFYRGRISFREVMDKYDNLNCSEIFSSKRFYSILYSYAIMTESYCKSEMACSVRKCDYSTSILEDKKQGFKFIEFFKFGFFWASVSGQHGDEFATLFDQACFSKESASEILGKSHIFSIGDDITKFIRDCVFYYKNKYPTEEDVLKMIRSFGYLGINGIILLYEMSTLRERIEGIKKNDSDRYPASYYIFDGVKFEDISANDNKILPEYYSKRYIFENNITKSSNEK
jgi:hypothetical protein